MASLADTATDAGEDALLARLKRTRAMTLALAEPLSDADATVQSMEDASPAKWHLAHSSWFFESFVLRDHVPGYRAHDPAFSYLFNSYYEAEGPRHARPLRGMLTRPSLDQVRSYRIHVDAALFQVWESLSSPARALVELGIAHEQQHQELLLTDICHLMSLNPLKPAVWPAVATHGLSVSDSAGWVTGREGPVAVGHDGEGFAFDAEGPRHIVHLTPHALADRLITNAEWEAFILDGGYRTPTLWLSDGWAWVQREHIRAPLYWQEGEDGRWRQFGLDGMQPADPAAPVCHISLYEADAFASWAGARLPTEAEWEAAAEALDPQEGNLLDNAHAVRPHRAPSRPVGALHQMFGDCWEWTGSAFRPYPGFRPAGGAIGEYNGKFMSGQFVLRGGSCATPKGSVRASTRNFFPPHARWQFTGLRLAKDL